MRFILFPGRHHLVTRFRVDRLKTLLAEHPGAVVVWAITSANHAGTQRNPVPGHRRLGIIEAVAATEGLPCMTFPIGNRTPKPNFPGYVVEEIRIQSDGAVAMNPENTLVACSTPELIAGYEGLGYEIDTLELNTGELRPWDVVEKIVAAGPSWRYDAEVAAATHPVALDQYRRYGIGDLVQLLYADPLPGIDDGGIIPARDHVLQCADFEDNTRRKVSEFAHAVRPGRILDIGCATGQTLKLLSELPGLFESDFYGVESARPLLEVCQQRRSDGDFGTANVFFHQRNIMETTLFAPNSLDTVITMAVTHEIESYLGHADLEDFISRVHSMLRPGGVWINYDVAAPDHGDEEVLVRFRTDDGSSSGELAGLNSRARFERFANDFRSEEGDGIAFGTETRDGEEYVRLTRSALYEFLARKDYVDSWFSEAHERFCFFSPDDWREAVEKAGFHCTPDTHGVRNPWLIENRFAPAAEVFGLDLVPDPWSWTNVLLVAEKPL